MTNKDYIYSLIYQTIYCPDGKEDEVLKKLYDEIQNVFNSDKYTAEEKAMLHEKAHLESLVMMLGI